MSANRRIKVILPPSRAGSLELVGGGLAWDFTNTSSARGSPARQEHLRDFDTLMQWVEHARIMPPSDCAYARAALAGHPRRSRRIFERAIEMRELIWTIGTALSEQRPLSSTLLELLSAAHAENLRHAEMKMRLGALERAGYLRPIGATADQVEPTYTLTGNGIEAAVS